MGLLSSKSLRQMAVGAGSRLLYRMDEARKSGEQGLADLKIARQEVDEEVANLKKTYDSALTVGSSVGGGTFANFLFGTNDIEYISALGQMAPDNRNDAISQLKKNFEALPQEERDKFEDYTKVSEQKFASDVNASKIKNGLQITNNMGNNTTNFLSRLMFEPPKDVKQKQEEVVSGFTIPEIQAPAPVTGAYEAISMTPSNIKIDPADILGYLKSSIETFGMTYADEKTTAQLNLEAEVQNDYANLINPNVGPAEKAKIYDKYYYRVLELKTPIQPTASNVITQPEVLDSSKIDELIDDINEDENPPYTG